MRIIIKPVGAIILVIALVILVALLMFKSRSANKVMAASAAPGAGGPTTKPVVPSPLAAVPSGSVIDPEKTKWKLVTQSPAEATMEETISAELPGSNKHAVHVVVTKVDPAKFWAAQMIKEVPQNVLGGKEMVVHFWGRSVQKTPVWVIFEDGKVPHTPELQEKVTLSPEWKQYELPFTTTADHTTPPANFCIKAGIQPGEIEVAGIYVDDK